MVTVETSCQQYFFYFSITCIHCNLNKSSQMKNVSKVIKSLNKIQGKKNSITLKSVFFMQTRGHFISVLNACLYFYHTMLQAGREKI